MMSKLSAAKNPLWPSLVPARRPVLTTRRPGGSAKAAPCECQAPTTSSNLDYSARSMSAESSAATRLVGSTSNSDSDVQVTKMGWWNELPARRRLTLSCAGALMLSNMDKVNLTLAILPMAQELGWSATTMGLVQSTFFYGFLLMQLPGGAVCSKMGGRKVLPIGVSIWSAATFFAPLLAGSIIPFCTSRVVMGMGEAVAPSAIVDILAKSVPKEERASSISTAFGGLHIGSIVGLLAAPPIINHFGWQGVFYAFGAAGLLWYFGFEMLIDALEATEPEVMANLGVAVISNLNPVVPPEQVASSCASDRTSTKAESTSASDIPYRAMLRSKPVQVLAATHFAHNWFHYTMLAWLPTYFVSALDVDLMHAAQTALLPPIAGIVASAAAGTLADKLVANGMETAHVRKLAQATAFVIPSMLLMGACASPCTPEDNIVAVSLITLALGISSFSLAGLYCTHQDLSPKYASTLLGITNVAASLPGIVGVAAVGAMYEATHSWELSLFLPSAAFMMLGAGVFTVAGTHEQIDFDALDNSPFAIEASLEPAKKWFSSVATNVQGLQDRAKGLVPSVASSQEAFVQIFERVNGLSQGLESKLLDGVFSEHLGSRKSPEAREVRSMRAEKVRL